MAKQLSAALAPLCFRRSQSSGAILGGKNERFMEQFSDDAKALFIGDVVPSNEADVARQEGWRCRFTIECKFYANADTLDHLMEESRIWGWYSKACIDSDKLPGKQPMLIFKFNRTPMYVAVDGRWMLPYGLTAMTTLHRFTELQGVSRIMNAHEIRMLNIFKYDDAIKHLDWWKITNDDFEQRKQAIIPSVARSE